MGTGYPDSVKEMSRLLRAADISKDEDEDDDSPTGEADPLTKSRFFNKQKIVESSTYNPSKQKSPTLDYKSAFEEEKIYSISSSSISGSTSAAMLPSSAITSDGESGPVSLSQILERDAHAPSSPSELHRVASASSSDQQYGGFGSSHEASGATTSSDKGVKSVDKQLGSYLFSDISSKGPVKETIGVCGDQSVRGGGSCSCVGDIVRGCITGGCHADQNSGSMYSTSGYKLPPLAARTGSGSHTNKSMGNGTSAASSSQSSKSDKYPSSPSSTKSNMPFGSNKMNQGVVYPQDYTYLKEKVKELKENMREEELKLDMHQSENSSLKRDLRAKNDEITQLKRENHKLKSVLAQHVGALQDNENLLVKLQEQHLMVGQGKSTKRQGVSGESGSSSDPVDIQHFNKDFRTKSLLKDAINDNDFLKHLDLDPCQMKEIIEAMYPQQFSPGSWIIKEGDVGSHLYVSAQGDLEVIKENKFLGRITACKAFGELAILYNCKRTASVKAVTEAKVWVLDRRVYQLVMKRSGLKKHEDNIAFLQSVQLFQNLTKDHLSRIADALQVDFYAPGSYIIRQGAIGDSFYILRSGKVKVTKKMHGKNIEEEVRELEQGTYFGEQALLREECRTASVIALSPGVECLVLDRDSFNQLIGDLSELREKDYGDENERPTRNILAPRNVSPEQEYYHIKLDDLDIVATLGVGGFGRVELVQYIHDPKKTFALKCLRKTHIVETQQQDHVYSEKRIMMNVRSPFICRLYKTFRDSKCVYMLMEPCLGGEVWTILRDRGWFDDHTARFISACVVEALDYLHSKNIIYRDLKPENLLLDNNGYVKLVDFGFSKYLGMSSKTWTFCGTPEYVAPEIILNKGHDRAVDYWSVGVLLYELLTGTPPFNASDPMKTYNIILKGIDMISFPPHVTRTATSLIKKLCRENVTERLGYQRGGIQDIKKHRWFQGFDWDGLNMLCLTPPIKPKVTSATDASNFDKYPRDLEVPPDENTGWDIDF